MGFRCAWIACKGWDVDTLIARSGRKRVADEPTEVDLGVYAVEGLGWAVLVGSGTQHFLKIDWEDAVSWSAETEVLYFAVNDTVMVSGLSALRNGEQVWSVSCNASEGEAPAESSGELPDVAQNAMADAEEAYETPADVGQALTGYRHDSVANGIPLDS